MGHNGKEYTMNWFLWIILGGLAGWVASILTRNNARMGLFANIIVGVIGGVVGGYLMDLFGASGVTGFNLWSFFVAVVGASVLLVLYNLIRKK